MDYVRHGKIQGQWVQKRTKSSPVFHHVWQECESISISTYITSGNSDYQNKLFSLVQTLVSNLVESREWRSKFKSSQILQSYAPFSYLDPGCDKSWKVRGVLKYHEISTVLEYFHNTDCPKKKILGRKYVNLSVIHSWKVKEILGICILKYLGMYLDFFMFLE